MDRINIENIPGSSFRAIALARTELLINTQKLFAAIDRDFNIAGAGVVYVDPHYKPLVLREFQPLCSPHPKKLLIHKLLHPVAPEQYIQRHANDPRQSRLLQELANTSLSCAGAVGGVVMMYAGGALSFFTGGAGFLISAAGYAATGASLLQCAIGGRRLYSELTDPAQNDALNDELWYKIISPLLDTIVLLGIATSALTIIKHLQVMRRTTGLSWFALGKRLNRQQLKKLMTETLSIRHPSLTAKQIKLKQRLGIFPKRFTPTEIRKATMILMGESFNSAMSLASSGAVQHVVITLFEDIPE